MSSRFSGVDVFPSIRQRPDRATQRITAWGTNQQSATQIIDAADEMFVLISGNDANGEGVRLPPAKRLGQRITVLQAAYVRDGTSPGLLNDNINIYPYSGEFLAGNTVNTSVQITGTTADGVEFVCVAMGVWVATFRFAFISSGVDSTVPFRIRTTITANGTLAAGAALTVGLSTQISTSASLTATGTTQGTGLALSANSDVYIIGTGSAGNQAVVLPTPALGYNKRMINRTGVTITVFPNATGGAQQIDSLGSNNGYVLENGGSVWFNAETITRYTTSAVNAPVNDASGSPGNATQNATTGKSAIAASAQSVTITNDCVTANSIVFANLMTNDATLLGVDSVVVSAGSFIIKGSAVATAATKVCWQVFGQ